MTDHNNENLAKFRSLIASWMETLFVADYAFIGIHEQGQKHLVFGRVILHSTILDLALPPESPPFQFEWGNVVAGRSIKTVEKADVDALLNDALTGTLRSQSGDFVLPRDT